MEENLKTSPTLLCRLKDGSDQQAWQIFYHRYGPVIVSFCAKRGLGEFDSRDVLQETAILLLRKLPKFDYTPEKGKFRNWLLTLVMGKIRDAWRRTQRQAAEKDASRRDPTSIELAGDDVENDWRAAMLVEALRRVREDPKLKTGTFDVFRAYVLDGQAVAEVAKNFKIEINAVYQVKNRLVKRLREEVADLEMHLTDTCN